MQTSIETHIPKITERFINHTQRHIFLTGKAGTGKTTFLRRIKETTHKNVIVAAPTGIAAINAQGVTLHSLFHLPFGPFIPVDIPLDEGANLNLNTPRTLTQGFRMNRNKRHLLRELELLIIDEVSMLRADLLDAIDVILRLIRRESQRPFGGVQILFIGDLSQLPPVVVESERAILGQYYRSPFFFNAKILAQDPPLQVELTQIYRQSDPTFITLLNHLREDRLTPADIEQLNQRYQPSAPPGEARDSIFLTTHNYKADDINRQSLAKLPGKPLCFTAQIEGDFKEHLYPVDFQLELKKDAQVMFMKNDYSGEKRYFNGKIGRVSQMNTAGITVSFPGESSSVKVEPYVWENKAYSLNRQTQEIEETIVGTFSQYPLRLAWAITIHKSQGLTFEKAVIDVSQAFAPGQVYVALSRLTSLAGLLLSAPLPPKMDSKDALLKDYIKQKPTLTHLNQELSQSMHAYIRNMVLQTYDFSGLLTQVQSHANSYQKDEKRSVKQQYQSWAMTLLNETKPLKEVADKFLTQLNRIFVSETPEYLPLLRERLEAAKQYFIPLFDRIAKKIQAHGGQLAPVKGTKTYVNELKNIEMFFISRKKQIHKALALVAAASTQTDFNRAVFEKSGWQSRRETPVSLPEAPKPPKKKTREITCALFKTGKTIQEIVEARGLAESTIKGHLVQCVERGQLDVKSFLTQDQIDEISARMTALATDRLTPLKESFNDRYTYHQLKMAQAYFRFKLGTKNEEATSS